MKSLPELFRRNLTPRVIGFDDAPFDHQRGASVDVAGIVCTGGAFEGMLWGQVAKDGLDATEALVTMVTQSKFHDQVHAILLDGLAFGGFNLIDLPTLSRRLERPCVAVMRRPPNMPSVHRALRHFHDEPLRRATIERAGEIHQVGGFVFQVMGATPEDTAQLLASATLHGNVPEPLRMAHLINSAFKTGQSSNRA